MFAVWSGENKPLKTEKIERDDQFWEEKMKEKLLTFYMNWLLPEIVDSRRACGMPLRENEILASTIDSTEKEPSPKRRRISKDSNVDDKENDPCINNTSCKKQLSFDEF